MRGAWRVATLALPFLLTLPALAAGETLGEVFRRVNPSVVVIRSRGQEVTAQGTSRFREVGSGVLISPDGKVVTAAHVVQTMDEISVEFLGEEPIPARVIASEPRADISIIQVSSVPPSARVAKLTDSDPLRVGDPIFLIGAPYGLGLALSPGIISARWEADTVAKEFPLAEFFQTDAVINTGNSGGPMFTRSGELVGIVSHMITKGGGYEGLGFVVTANTVRKLLVERNRRYYGLDAMFVTGAMAEALKVPQAGGLLIKQVAKDSIGARLGLRGGDRIGIVEGQQIVVGGDILLKVQGRPVTSNAELGESLKTLETIKPGDELRVTVLRDEKPVELSMKWTEQ